ncbi:MAG TPA: FAD binding domain-containing protein [Candidatus Sulfomarinibacteraceae bacterium]|nr:FAD binding domain-containing protein [Candidatus Sulfomarinibacteraceae bacterium]
MSGYSRPATLPEVLAALAAGAAEGRPRVIVAGATDHYPARVGRVLDEEILDVSALAGLREIREIDGGWLIQAGATWTDLVERPLPPWFDGFKRAARAVGGLGVQNRGTIVGNLCNASPAADGVPNLLALDAIVELASARGTRRMPVSAFVTGNRTTVRAADELVTAVHVPDPTGGEAATASSTFLKLGARAYLVISIAMVAAVLVRDVRGRITSARIAVGACSPVALRLSALEAALEGRQLAPGIGSVVRPDHLAELRPIDDVRGSAAYRLDAAGTLIRRALEELAS